MDGRSGTEERREKRIETGLFVLVLSIVAVTFAPAVGYGFVDWDDPLYVVQNPLVEGGPGVPLPDRLLTPALGYPVPVTVLSYSVERAVFGPSPVGHHVVNVALHLGGCALLYVLARRLGLGALAAAFAVALFGLHPAAAEPVSWISGRKDVLAGVFSFAAALEFLRGTRAGFRPARLLLLLLLAVLSKPSALFLVPVFFVWHLLFVRKGAFAAARASLPAALAGSVVFVVSLLGHVAMGGVRGERNAFALLREAWYALGYHFAIVLGVEPPCVKHFPATWPLHFEPLADLLPLALAALAGLGYVAAGAARRTPYLASIAWAFFSYLPSSSLIPLERYLADSYVYLPMAGVGLAMATVLDRAVVRAAGATGRLAAALAVVLSSVALAVPARRASLQWKDDVALWSAGVRRYPNEYRLCRNLGNAYVALREPERALEVYESCAARTSYEPFRKNIAIALFLSGRTDEARRAFADLSRETPEDPVVQKYLHLLADR
jgi:hypothetical protein